MTNAMTELCNKELRRPGGEFAATDPAVGEDPFLRELGIPFLDRPVFLGDMETNDFGADLMLLAGLITTLHERLFDGDLSLLCRELGVPDAHARLMCHPSPAAPPLFGRVDAYQDEDSLKILEFNASSDAGGLHWTTPVSEAFLRQPAFSRFAGLHQLRPVDTVGMLVDSLRETAAPVMSGHEPVIALVEGPGGLEQYGSLAWGPLQRLLRARDVDCHLGEVTDLRFQNGGVHLGDIEVDVVYRVFDLAQVAGHSTAYALTERLLTAHENGEVALWTHPQTEAFRNKRCMTYLSDPRLRGGLSAAEKAAVDRRLPWTRALHGSFNAMDQDLTDRLLERREHLILKPDNGFGGKGIVRGWETDASHWRRALTEAAPYGAVVQERVVPVPEEVVDPVDGTFADYENCWGLYYFPAGFGGGGGRLVPAGSHSSVFDEDPLRATLFTYPEQRRPDGGERP